LAGWLAAPAAALAGNLEEEFRDPPAVAKPLTWWHWIDGNVTPGGITKDLEAMQRAGLGGCYLFNIGGFFPEGPVKFMDNKFLALLDHTLAEASRLGLKFGIHNCDGWSESGGPWITPETSMKILTHTALDMAGGAPVEMALPVPAHKLEFYRDVAVIAFPHPGGGVASLPGPGVEWTGSIPPKALAALVDADPATEGALPAVAPGAAPHWLQCTLPEAETVRSVVFHRPGNYRMEEDYTARLEVSGDGVNFREAGRFSPNWDTRETGAPATVAVEPVPARHFRIVLENPWPVSFGGIELSTAAKLHYAEGKAGRIRQRGHGGETLAYDNTPGPDRGMALPRELRVDPSTVVDLTSRMDQNGILRWEAPPGTWRVLRIGYTTNGHTNVPATPAGTGLECDKLDPAVVRFHMEQYVGKLAARFGEATGKVFAAIETDSWECGIQNWTGGLEKTFAAECGYDLTPWLPLLLEGWVVDSYDASERMLWDWRRFLADQFSACYFSEVERCSRKLNLTYVIEGSGRQMYLYDPIGYQRHGDVPMGEFWIGQGVGTGLRVDNKVASSAAHLDGRRVVASEAYTTSAGDARWQNHPYSMKALGDSAYAAGVNQFVFHTFAHQPYETPGPGFTMAHWGVMANRRNTWWEPGAAWYQYLTRCNHLLQEGRFVADILAFIGEDVPNRAGFRADFKPAIPEGFDYDACDARALKDATVRDGKIVLPPGMEYAVLVMPARPTLRPEVLERVRDLVRDGAAVQFPVPVTQSPSLRDKGAGDGKVHALMKELGQPGATGFLDQVRAWLGGKPAATAQTAPFPLGQGRVFHGDLQRHAVELMGLAPDFSCGGEKDILYIHRVIDGADVYFVSNQQSVERVIPARFRVAGRQPEIWDPVTGATTKSGLYQTGDGWTELPLRLDPVGSCFVVFRAPAPPAHAVAVEPAAVVVLDDTGVPVLRTDAAGEYTLRLGDGTTRTLRADGPAAWEITQPWEVEFPKGLGAPAKIRMERPASWTEHADPGVRHFSGTAVCRTTFAVPSPVPPRLMLDLGDVQVMAEVIVNGKNLGVLWKPPFRIHVTGAARPGPNDLEVRVTNLWPNRMVADEEYPPEVQWKKGTPFPAQWPEWLTGKTKRTSPRITFTTRRTFKKGDPLLPSGLLGPVRLVPVVEVPVP
jgi:hypothetical protein